MVHVFRARRAGLGFATFFWKVAKKRNPNNPGNQRMGVKKPGRRLKPPDMILCA
jgi:hypothetical protein